MANKIVQLEDKAGNNLFPVAGSMKGDSVTTAMLQDGAVTAGKIDFTTVRTDITSLAPSGSERIIAEQFGNLVIITMSNLKVTSGDAITTITLPTALRPSREYNSSAGVLNSAYQPISAAIITLTSNGEMRVRVNNSNAYYVRGEIVYFLG